MSDNCNYCIRKGLAILVVLYGVIPKEAAKGLGKSLLPLAGNFGKGVTDKPLEDSVCILRGPEPGYIYIRYPTYWAGYMIDAAGFPRFFPDLNIEDMPKRVPPESMVVKCESQGKRHTGIEAVCIESPDTVGGPVYMAYSRHRWTKAVRTQHAKNPARHMRLIAHLDGRAFEHAETATVENLKRVVDFVPGAANQINHYLPPGADVVDRSAKAESLLNAMLGMSGSLKQPGLIVALHDTVGIQRNLNLNRHARLGERVLYESDADVAWKKLSCDSIAALRERIFNRKKAEVVQDATGKPWSQDNNPSHLKRSNELLYKRDFERQLANGSLLKGSRFVPSAPGSMVGNVEVPTDTKVAQAVRSDHKRLEGHYDEAARTRFATDHANKLKDYDRKIMVADKDYALWLNAPSQPGQPNLQSLCEHDFTESDHDNAEPYIQAISISLAGGPMTDASLQWFKATLAEAPNSPKQLLLSPLMGNMKELKAYLNEDKRDKVYDGIKGWLTAEDMKASKWLAPAVASYANPILMAVGATAMALNKDGSIDKALRERMVQTARATLALWEKTEVVAVKMRMKVGDLQQAALSVGFAQALTATSAKGMGAARVPARLRLPQVVASKAIDAVFWTTEKVDDFLARLPKAPADPAKVAAAWVEAANDFTKAGVQGARRAIPPGQTRDLAARWLKFGDSVAGKPGGLLAAGVLVLQAGQFTENLEKVTSLSGPGQLDALLGLGDAFASLLGGGAELASEIHKARQIATKGAYDKALLGGLARVAAGLGAVGSAFNAVQSGAVAYRRWNEGDNDARNLHFSAAGGYAVAAVASGMMVVGVKATFFGSMLGLGPVGWAILGTVAGVALTYAALNAEDTDAERFVARNAHWSISKRPEPPYTKWLDEAEAFTGLWYGVKAKLHWGDTLAGITGLGLDQLKVDIEVAESDTAEGWRYRLWLTFPNGKEAEIYNRSCGKVPTFVSPYAGQQAEMRAYDSNKPHYVDGRDFKLHGFVAERQGSKLKITHPLGVNDKHFQRARLEFEYYPTAVNLEEKVRIEVTRGDSE